MTGEVLNGSETARAEYGTVAPGRVPVRVPDAQDDREAAAVQRPVIAVMHSGIHAGVRQGHRRRDHALSFVR